MKESVEDGETGEEGRRGEGGKESLGGGKSQAVEPILLAPYLAGEERYVVDP
jgi:hypothetical protein